MMFSIRINFTGSLECVCVGGGGHLCLYELLFCCCLFLLGGYYVIYTHTVLVCMDFVVDFTSIIRGGGGYCLFGWEDYCYWRIIITVETVRGPVPVFCY